MNMKKKRVLHITTSLKIGGAETLLVNLLQAPSSDLDYVVIFFHDGPNRAHVEAAGIRCIPVNGRFFLYDPIFFMRLAYTIWIVKPHLIHAWLWSANLLAACIGYLYRIPVIVSIHSVYNKTAVAQNNFFKTVLDRIMLHCASSIVFVSASTKKLYTKAHPSIALNKVVVINNAIKDSCFAVPTVKKEKNIFVVGSVGRFIPLKNHDVLIDAFYELSKKYAQLRLVLIGYGQLETFLKNKVNSLLLHEKVTFIKTTRPQDYYPYFDCFVLPSDQEGLSISLLEAMSFGLPSIVASHDGHHDVITDRINGFICRAEKNSLMKIMEELLCNNSLHNQVSLASRATIEERFSFACMQQQYNDLYMRLARLNQ